MSSSTGWVTAVLFVLFSTQAEALQNQSAKHSSDRQHQGSQTNAPYAKPEFLIQAQKELQDAEVALQAEQKALEHLRQEEEGMRQASISKSGSWIEPSELWKKKQLLKQTIETREKAVVSAKHRLTRAEYMARSTSESNWARQHRPSWFRSWWQW